MTPVEFVKEALGHGQDAWRKDIEYHGKPLSSLIQVSIARLVTKCLTEASKVKQEYEFTRFLKTQFVLLIDYHFFCFVGNKE